MDHFILGLLVIALIIFIFMYLTSEGFFDHYTSGGKQRFASQFTSTNQDPESISESAFATDFMEANRAAAVTATKGMGDYYNKDVRKNSTRTENFSQDNLPSLVLDSVLMNRNIEDTGISGTEVLLQNSLHNGMLYDNYF